MNVTNREMKAWNKVERMRFERQQAKERIDAIKAYQMAEAFKPMAEAANRFLAYLDGIKS